MVNLIPGKIYKISRGKDESLNGFWVGDLSQRIKTNKKDGNGNELFDIGILNIPNNSLLLYIGTYNHEWAAYTHDFSKIEDTTKIIESYLFIFEKKQILIHKDEIDKNGAKHLTIQHKRV